MSDPTKDIVLGKPDEPLRIIAFAAGGLNSAMQLGMIHALLVSDAQPPHIASGTSAGAVAAAALAEVMLAGSAGADEDQRRLSRVARFRAFFDQAQSMSDELTRNLVPDLTEVSTRAALQPLHLPTHSPAETTAREETVDTKFGIVRLLNTLLASRLRISELTRIVYRVLQLRQVLSRSYPLLERLAAYPGWRPLSQAATWILRRAEALAVTALLWTRLLVPLLKDAPLVTRTLVAGFCGDQFDELLHEPADATKKRSLGRELLQRCRRFFAVRLGMIHRTHARGILFWSKSRSATSLLAGAISYPLVLLAWVTAVIWAPLVYLYRLWEAALAGCAWARWASLGAIGLGYCLLEWIIGNHLAFRAHAHQLRAGTLPGLINVVIDGFILALPVIVTFVVLRCESPPTRSEVQRSVRVGVTSLVLTGGLFSAVIGILALVFRTGLAEATQLITRLPRPGVVLAQAPPPAWAPEMLLCLSALSFFFYIATVSRVSKILASLALRRDLLSATVLRQLLIRAFDPDYFGTPDFAEAVNRALGGLPKTPAGEDASGRAPKRQQLGRYLTRQPESPILVLPVAADIGSGKVQALPSGLSTVDALTAACAKVPWFRAQQLSIPEAGGACQRHWFIDAADISLEPIHGIFDTLKRLWSASTASALPDPLFPRVVLAENIPSVELYVMSPFPTQRFVDRERLESRQALNAPPRKGVPATKLADPWPAKSADKLADTSAGTLHRLERVFTLQAAHAAKDERAVTILLTFALLDQTSPFFMFDPTDARSADNCVVRAHLIPIEPEQSSLAVSLRTRMGGADRQRQAIADAVAEGCRITLRTLFTERAREAKGTAGCAKLVRSLGAKRLPGSISRDELTGKEQEQTGPGLPEICCRCKLAANPAMGFWEEAPPASGDLPNSEWPVVGKAEPIPLDRPTSQPGPAATPDSLAQDAPNVALPGNGHGRVPAPQSNSTGESQSSAISPLHEAAHESLKSESTPATAVLAPEREAGARAEVSAGSSAPVARTSAIKSRMPIEMGKAEAAPPGEGAPPRNGQAAASDAREWPKPRDGVPGSGKSRPTVSLVLSGGVFRGVYQVGVLTALNEVGMKPDLVAGASVGTIVAAMAARILGTHNPSERHQRLALLAGSFLTIDRLVLTDRFADFVRHLTLRTGNARFSLRDFDHLLRRYDCRSFARFANRSRRVLAGLHRILHLAPRELAALAQLHETLGQLAGSGRLLEAGQAFLDRVGIGEELLGAEALERLIFAHALPPEQSDRTFDEFTASTDYPIQFLATATNLTTGALDLLASFEPAEKLPLLVPGLLASSAFPAVFRPRQSWEVRPAAEHSEYLVDGGIVDNLPLAPVARMLHVLCEVGRLKYRPQVDNQPVPHLIFTASLEPRRRLLSPDDPELERIATDWIALRRRARELSYNVKVDRFQLAQSTIRRIHQSLEKRGKSHNPMIDMHVMCVRPEWLCGTFAFHPMLGFQRDAQAKSIAHGCASTLAHLALEQERTRAATHAWTEHWWKLDDFDPSTTEPHLHEAAKAENVPGALMLKPARRRTHGQCWFRTEGLCPYSRQALSKLQDSEIAIAPETMAALNEIYLFCGRASTHRR